MVRLVADRARAENVPSERLIAVHADLGRAEWPGTAELVRAQAEAAGVAFVSVTRPQGDLLKHVERRGMWPSPTARYCTSDHKRSQIAKVVTRLDRERRTKETFRVLNCMGIRAEESSARRKKRALAPNRYLSTRSRSAWDWLPIHDWTEQDVWNDIRASGAPYHPAYDLGMPRLSCVLCIYAPTPALVLAGKHNPRTARRVRRHRAAHRTHLQGRPRHRRYRAACARRRRDRTDGRQMEHVARPPWAGAKGTI